MTADSETMNDLAAHSLDLVNREVANTLDAARRELEDFVEEQAGRDALTRAADLLHLAQGALKLIELNGAGMLAEEMEHLCRHVAGDRSGEGTDAGLEALTRAMVQLPAYLERVMNGGRDIALVLLPLVNELREARGAAALSEGSVLLLDAGPFERRLAAQPPQAGVDAGDSRRFELTARKLRPTLQAALLHWIKGEDPAPHLNKLIEVCDALENAASAEAVGQLWHVLGGVLIALRAGDLEASVGLKRLVGQADRQLKRLIDNGEAAWISSPPVDLLNSLLYYVARARGDHERLAAIREAYRLDDVVPGEEQLAEAREELAGPSVKLMRTVAKAIKEDLSSVKDALDIFVRTGMEDVEQLRPQLEMLKKIGDTLGVLGLDAARERIQHEIGELSAVLGGGRPETTAVLEQTAAALLDVEDALDRELMRSAAPDAHVGAQAEGDAEAQYRHVTQAVMGECIVNLAKVKETVTQLLQSPGDGRALEQVEPQLRGITAGLLMLNKTRAVKVVERIGSVIAERLGPERAALKSEHLERLADAVVSVEYYMETISRGRSDPWYMLDNAGRCLDLLENLPPSRQAEGEAAATAPQPKGAEEPPSVMEVDEERSDPELLELFIEEAKEEIASIERFLPLWAERPDDSEALIAVRRSFHTLKGSGRMVGAQLLGEFAWSVENLLNRLINQTLEPAPAMIEFIGEAANALPQLVEQLEAGIEPRVDVPLLMKRAEAFAEGDPAAAGMTGDSLSLPEPEADTQSPPPEEMDPVLAEIFVKETRGHLETIRAFVEQARQTDAPHPVEEPVYRACHTLYGSAKMADFAPAVALAGPLTAHLGRTFEAGEKLSDEDIEVLAVAADEIARMAEALSENVPFAPEGHVVAKLRGLPRAYAPDDEALPDGSGGGEPEPPGEPAEPPSGERDADAPAGAAASAEFDPEVAAIFTEEAAEILDNAETALDAMRRDGTSPASLVELQRLLHTLKGGARMASIKPMGDLSHALETLLAGMAEGRVAPAPDALELVQECLDRLHQMRDRVESGSVGDDVGDLIERVERYGGDARGPSSAPADDGAAAQRAPQHEPTSAPAEPPEPEAGAPAGEAAAASPELQAPAADSAPGSPAGDAESTAGAGGAPPAEEPTRRQPRPQLAGADAAAEPPAGAEPASTGDAGPQASPPPSAESDAARRDAAAELRSTERAETARVDAALLDTLLNGAGEISIFQSRLNQQLHSIDFNLGELGETVTRLREQLRKLEAETEAQILYRHQEDVSADQGFDPLELDRYSTIQQLSRALAETANDVASINELLQGLSTEADSLLTQQARAASELQEGLMQTRMVPFQRHVSRLARIVRQAAAETGKSADLVAVGGESQVDRQVLAAMLPPLEHLLRNAVVHGIETPEGRRGAGKPETGRVELKLRREGSEVLLEAADDGAGLDVDAIRRKALEHGLVHDPREVSDQEAAELILRPGFSTANELTQSAGRGVGMDVVHNEVKKLGGSMRIESARGQGTRFLVRLPYTLAVTHALIVNVGDESFALPLPTVEGVTRVPREKLLEMLVEDDPKIEYGDVSYRIQHLGSLVGGMPSALPEEEGAVSLVLVRAGESSTALLTDSLEGSKEIVVKTLGPHISSIPGVSGATILADGRVVVILDAGTLIRGRRAPLHSPVQPEPASRPPTALVVDDSITMRRVTQRLLERRGVRVLTARDGLDAISVLQENEPDIILLDIEMPRMDGYQFASHVRNDDKLKDVPIVMITSRSGEKHRAKAIELGVNDYLSKPYQEAQLVGSVETLLGRSL